MKFKDFSNTIRREAEMISIVYEEKLEETFIIGPSLPGFGPMIYYSYP